MYHDVTNNIVIAACVMQVLISKWRLLVLMETEQS